MSDYKTLVQSRVDKVRANMGGVERNNELLEILIDVQLNIYEEVVQISKDMPDS